MILFMIGSGIAAYLYGLAVCKGVLLDGMNKKVICFSFGASALWQIIVLAIGNLLAFKLHAMGITKSEYPVNAFACLMIFGILAMRMFIKAIKNEPIEERRIKKGEFYRLISGIFVAVGFDTFLTGLALGLLQTPVFTELFVLVILSAAGVIGGLYSGWRFGYGQRNSAYILSGTFLLVGDFMLLLQYFRS